MLQFMGSQSRTRLSDLTELNLPLKRYQLRLANISSFFGGRFSKFSVPSMLFIKYILEMLNSLLPWRFFLLFLWRFTSLAC